MSIQTGFATFCHRSTNLLRLVRDALHRRARMVTSSPECLAGTWLRSRARSVQQAERPWCAASRSMGSFPDHRLRW